MKPPPNVCYSFTLNTLNGLLHDAYFAFLVISFPVSVAAHTLALLCRKLGTAKLFHNRHFWGAVVGAALVIVSFDIEHLFRHPIWSATIETTRSVGVCPIWEALAVLVNFRKIT
jgi:hypothetical protein